MTRPTGRQRWRTNTQTYPIANTAACGQEDCCCLGAVLIMIRPAGRRRWRTNTQTYPITRLWPICCSRWLLTKEMARITLLLLMPQQQQQMPLNADVIRMPCFRIAIAALIAVTAAGTTPLTPRPCESAHEDDTDVEGCVGSCSEAQASSHCTYCACQGCGWCQQGASVAVSALSEATGSTACTSTTPNDAAFEDCQDFCAPQFASSHCELHTRLACRRTSCSSLLAPSPLLPRPHCARRDLQVQGVRLLRLLLRLRGRRGQAGVPGLMPHVRRRPSWEWQRAQSAE